MHESRRLMVREQLEPRGIRDEAVLQAMNAIPRELFVPKGARHLAYADRALRIGHDQTISQPYMVALMTQSTQPAPDKRILEIGTGSGYQAAVLARIVSQVFTIERIRPLADAASECFSRLGIRNIRQMIGDGTMGWPEQAPFDAIVVTAGAPDVPRALQSQLAEGGLMVIPVGSEKSQRLVVLRREGNKLEKRHIIDCRFVKLIGREGWESDDGTTAVD